MENTNPHSPAPDNNDRPAGVPRGELFSDVETRLVWAAIDALSEGQRRELLAHMQTRIMPPELRSDRHAVRIARVVGALHAAGEQLRQEQGLDSVADVNLTETEYERLRRLNEIEGWPPPSTVRRWMGGGWNDALRQGKLQPVFDGDALVAELGSKFTREEILTALLAYHGEGHEEIPTLRGFISWAKRPDVLTRPGRRPRSLGPINRVFPLGWPQALAAAGLIAHDEVPTDDNGGSWSVARPAWRTGYTEEHVHDALVACAKELGRSPKMGEYDAWRDDEFQTMRREGLPPRAIPSTGLIQNRYQTWDAALVSAGLEPARGRQNANRAHTFVPRTKVFADEEVFAYICEAYEQMGDPFTARAYKTWRETKETDNRRKRLLAKVPSYYVLHERFGNFAEAVRPARKWQAAERAANRADASTTGGEPAGEAPTGDQAPEDR